MVAVGILTYMVFWMRKVSKSVKMHLEGAIDQALSAGKGQGWALVAMVFFAVAREGLESVFFLLAAFQQDVGAAAPIGAVLGLVAAIVLGMMIYWGGVKLHRQVFQMDQPVHSVRRRRPGRRGDPRLPRSRPVEPLP